MWVFFIGGYLRDHRKLLDRCDRCLLAYTHTHSIDTTPNKIEKLEARKSWRKHRLCHVNEILKILFGAYQTVSSFHATNRKLDGQKSNPKTIFHWGHLTSASGALTSLQPDTVTFNTLLQMVPEPTRALQLLRDMQVAWGIATDQWPGGAGLSKFFNVGFSGIFV